MENRLLIAAHVFKVKGLEEYHMLPKRKEAGRGEEFVDFEECFRQGIDAIEYDYTEAHRDQEAGEEMDFKMLGLRLDSDHESRDHSARKFSDNERR
ncbi:MAG: hypothetical protein NC548_64645 [Lachnospiraceae bacterium]|nr:hypothetical protein [Lachnospiraceae bacterium]